MILVFHGGLLNQQTSQSIVMVDIFLVILVFYGGLLNQETSHQLRHYPVNHGFLKNKLHDLQDLCRATPMNENPEEYHQQLLKIETSLS